MKWFICSRRFQFRLKRSARERGGCVECSSLSPIRRSIRRLVVRLEEQSSRRPPHCFTHNLSQRMCLWMCVCDVCARVCVRARRRAHVVSVSRLSRSSAVRSHTSLTLSASLVVDTSGAHERVSLRLAGLCPVERRRRQRSATPLFLHPCSDVSLERECRHW